MENEGIQRDVGLLVNIKHSMEQKVAYVEQFSLRIEEIDSGLCILYKQFWIAIVEIFEDEVG